MIDVRLIATLIPYKGQHEMYTLNKSYPVIPRRGDIIILERSYDVTRVDFRDDSIDIRLSHSRQHTPDKEELLYLRECFESEGWQRLNP